VWSAARNLADAGVRVTAIATHLVIAHRTSGGWVVDVLRHAAADAFAQGLLGRLLGFLRAPLHEPSDGSLRSIVLSDPGMCEHDAGESAAVEHLLEAWNELARERL
jgi:hypothetical protein